MVFRLDGCSFYYAAILSKSGISICWRHLDTSKVLSNPIYFRKRPILFHTWATCAELPSYISTMAMPLSLEKACIIRDTYKDEKNKKEDAKFSFYLYNLNRTKALSIYRLERKCKRKRNKERERVWDWTWFLFFWKCIERERDSVRERES